MKQFFPRLALLLGNIVTGVSILGPAGMLPQLADGLHVSIRDAGLLVTYGAVVVCICSPLMAWLTTRLDRRLLLSVTLAVMAVGQAVSALAADYAVILVVRLIMLVFAALYTPQAAATVALIAPERERPSAIAFVFLGWSLAIAGGLPLVTLLASHVGWQETFAVLAAIAGVGALLQFLALPAGVQGHPLSLSSFGEIARSRRIVLILLITMLQTSGQFTIFVYLAPLLDRLAGAGPGVVGGFFALYGAAGLTGNTVASAVVSSLGTQRTLALFMGSTFIGLVLWSVGTGVIVFMGAGMMCWGFGFAAINSMQQARLATTAPDLASVSIALNTSVLYVGQAIGSGIGGLLFASGHLNAMGYAGVAFLACAWIPLALTWEKRAAFVRVSGA